MGILIKAGVDDHGLRSRKSIAETSTTSTSNGHTATATTYNKHPVTSIHTATATTYNDERNPRKEGFRAMRDPRRHPPHHDYYDPCDCRGGCQWVWGYNICYVRDPHRCGWANHSRLRPGEKWRRCPWG